MPVSLSAKLRDLRRELRPKFNGGMLYDHDQLKLIARHMPMNDAALRALIPDKMVDAYGKQILGVTTEHTRDQECFEECVKEIGAFTASQSSQTNSQCKMTLKVRFSKGTL